MYNMKRRRRGRPIRVLHCPAMVGGNPQTLARAEREIGLESWAVSFYQSRIGYETDEVLWKEGDHPIICEAKRFWLLWRAIRDFDIIHFNFGQSIFPHQIDFNPHSQNKLSAWIHNSYGKYPLWIQKAYNIYARVFELHDLYLLKKAGKGIVVTYQGNDARQSNFFRANFEIHPGDEVEHGYYSEKSDLRKRYRIDQFARFADRIYALNPDLLHVLPRRAQFLPYSNVDLREWHMREWGVSDSMAPVVIHAPSHHGVKGTKYVLDTISKLKSDGIRFEFVLVDGIPHAEARPMYERAHLLIDQLLIGWYGGLAVEFMALGRPVMCYIRESDLQFIPKQMREDLPVIKVTPNTLYNEIKIWLTVRLPDLRKLGWRSRSYVERWHDPLKIAAYLKKEYEAIMRIKKTAETN